MQEELLATYDAFNRPIGSANRALIHTLGLWHRSVNFIVLDENKRTVVFQDEHTLADYDAQQFFVKMNGGHAHTDNMLEEASRELDEEFGLQFSGAEQIHFLGTYQISFETTKAFINHEFMYFYLISFRDPFDRIRMDGSEVKSIFEISIDSAIDVIVGDRDDTLCSARDVNDQRISVTLTKHSFRNFTDDSLYLRLFLAAQDFCNGRTVKFLVI